MSGKVILLITTILIDKTFLNRLAIKFYLVFTFATSANLVSAIIDILLFPHVLLAN